MNSAQISTGPSVAQPIASNTATRAHQIGLVSELAAGADALYARADGLARALAAEDPTRVAAAKRAQWATIE